MKFLHVKYYDHLLHRKIGEAFSFIEQRSKETVPRKLNFS